MNPELSDYFKKIGSMGGKKRAWKYGITQRRKWGKMGGRPVIHKKSKKRL